MPALRVQIEYDQVGAAANRFAQESAETEDLLARIQNLVDQLQGGGWIGRGADAFYAEMFDEVLPAVGRMAEALEETSTILRRISQILNDAEQNCVVIIQQTG